ncbi:UNVERIFIED_CONTAM: Cysteine-rich repeat secretory protein 55 [Sesamum radiatum]|uniref:Cysteine-rich repeat secretory protein 55 n=1 Tax=Sesamum radiatum TaxID=300843 RepID=A0AAW2W4Q3_SESRA
MNLLSNLLFLFFLCIYSADSADPVYTVCDGDSQPSRNIDGLLNKLVSGTIQNGFITTSYGVGKYQIYGLAQCRGDVSKAVCSVCIQDAAERIRADCVNQADSRIWYDFCFLRYSTVKFFGDVDTFGLYLYNIENVTDPDVFNKKLADLTNQISSEAVKPGSKGLGKGKTDISSFIRLYALVQCTRDLSKLDCAQCIAIAIENFSTICADRKGCRVLYSSCYVRYELYPFSFLLIHTSPWLIAL